MRVPHCVCSLFSVAKGLILTVAQMYPSILMSSSPAMHVS